MAKVKPVLDQLNLVSADPTASIAFYRRLGVDIAETAIWRTATGTHHVNARSGEVDFEVDSTTFAQVWNPSWRGRGDLKGRVVLGFRVTTREAVDEVYAEMTAAGYAGLQPPHDAFWGARYAIVEDPDGIAVGLMSRSRRTSSRRRRTSSADQRDRLGAKLKNAISPGRKRRCVSSHAEVRF